jgi:hypothetical protein
MLISNYYNESRTLVVDLASPVAETLVLRVQEHIFFIHIHSLLLLAACERKAGTK